jgi:hypothetical protein
MGGSVPLIHGDRAFILEDPAAPGVPSISVAVERDGGPLFEVRRGEPGGSPDVTVRAGSGGIAVSGAGGDLLYRITIGEPVRVLLRPPGGSEDLRVEISGDRLVLPDGEVVARAELIGGAEAVIGEDGRVALGGDLPAWLLTLGA